MCLHREAPHPTKVLRVWDIFTSADNFPSVIALIPLWRVCVRRATAEEAAASSLSLAMLFIYFFKKGGVKKLMFADVWHRRGGPDRGADGGCINNVRCDIPQTHLVQISHV